MPKTIFVAGAGRGAGKTLVSEFLLRSLPGVGAVKITCRRGEGVCPHGRECGVCGALKEPFAIIQDQAILAEPGKDTARLLNAASAKVIWLQSREEALADALAAALSAFDRAQVVLVEGNAAFQAFAPDLGLLVIGSGPGPFRKSVRVALEHIDGVVLNLRAGRQPPGLIDGLRQDLPTFSFDASAPWESGEAQALITWVAQGLGISRAVRAAPLEVLGGP